MTDQFPEKIGMHTRITFLDFVDQANRVKAYEQMRGLLSPLPSIMQRADDHVLQVASSERGTPLYVYVSDGWQNAMHRRFTDSHMHDWEVFYAAYEKDQSVHE